MKTELEHGYTLELYEKFNYGTVKRKYFEDMLDLVTFTNKNARKYNTNYIINVIKKMTLSLCIVVVFISLM